VCNRTHFATGLISCVQQDSFCVCNRCDLVCATGLISCVQQDSYTCKHVELVKQCDMNESCCTHERFIVYTLTSYRAHVNASCRQDYALQRTAMHCNALQRTASHYNALQHTATDCHTMQHTATQCNTWKHMNTSWQQNFGGPYEWIGHHIVSHCVTLQHAVKRYNILKYTTTYGNTLQRATTCYNMLQHTATRCNTLQHDAAHCNTL